MGTIGKEIKSFDVNVYGGVDLERLGKIIIEHVIRHIGMIRYERSGIKVFDITDRELGELTDTLIRVLKGVKTTEGVSVYRDAVKSLLDVIADLEGEKVKGSIVNSLKRAVVEELKLFSREFVYFEGLWEL